MAESGYYEKRPRPEQRQFLVSVLRGKPTVSSVVELDDFHFVVERGGKSTLRIYLTNIYILSVADVMEIMQESPETTCIVSTMNYNHYSPQAKQYCREQGVGLFRSDELFGAVYYDGDRFLDYVRPER